MDFRSSESFQPVFFIFNRTRILFEFWIPFLSFDLFPTIVVKSSNPTPSAFCRSLSSLRVEFVGKGILLGQNATIFIEVVFINLSIVHPVTQAFILDELSGANRFVNRAILPVFSFGFELVNYHGSTYQFIQAIIAQSLFDHKFFSD